MLKDPNGGPHIGKWTRHRLTQAGFAEAKPSHHHISERFLGAERCKEGNWLIKQKNNSYCRPENQHIEFEDGILEV